jgi:6-pyruvoyltetrahydropterin/6-carboxytetrahydropterin synthase
MCVNRIEVLFDAGHCLLDYRGKCSAPHGHSYRAEVLAAVPKLDALGLALDFGDIKGPIKGWVDAHWDHAFLLNDRDVTLVTALQAIPESKLYLFHDANPSAEVMARELYAQARQRLGSVVVGVRIWESPGQYAQYAPDDASSPVVAALSEEMLP